MAIKEKEPQTEKMFSEREQKNDIALSNKFNTEKTDDNKLSNDTISDKKFKYALIIIITSALVTTIVTKTEFVKWFFSSIGFAIFTIANNAAQFFSFIINDFVIIYLTTDLTWWFIGYLLCIFYIILAIIRGKKNKNSGISQ